MCGLTVVCMLTRSRLSHHYRARRLQRGGWPGRARAGWGGRRRGRGGQTTGTTGRVTTTPLAPLVHQNWCTLYYGHWSSPCRHPALWLDQEPRHCFHDVWRWREGVRVIRTPARGGYGLSALLCCGMTWGGISTGVTRLSTI